MHPSCNADLLEPPVLLGYEACQNLLALSGSPRTPSTLLAILTPLCPLSCRGKRQAKTSPLTPCTFLAMLIQAWYPVLQGYEAGQNLLALSGSPLTPCTLLAILTPKISKHLFVKKTFIKAAPRGKVFYIFFKFLIKRNSILLSFSQTYEFCSF